MLPKDLLKYARKFSPEEIKQAILTAVKGSHFQQFVDDYMQKLHAYQRNRQLAEAWGQTNVGQWGTTIQTVSSPYTTRTVSNDGTTINWTYTTT